MAGNNRRRSTESQRGSSNRGDSSRGGTRSGGTRTASNRSTQNGSARGNGKASGASAAGMIAVVLVVIVVVVAIAGVLVWTNVKYLYDNTTIVPGVEIEGVNIGGMTRDEAYASLNSKLNEKINQLSITLKHGDQYWTYDASSLGAQGDISGIIDEAMKYGHVGEIRARLDEAKYVLENPEIFEISFGYDQNAVRQIIETLKIDLDVAAIEPTLEFDKDAGKITSLEDRSALEYNPLKFDPQININGIPAEVYIDADGNYRINAEIFVITEGSSGYEVDVESTLAAVLADLADDSVANADIVTVLVNPTLTVEELENSTTLVYHSKSGLAYTSTEARDRNIDVALASFDGLVIMPGQTVSFNETTGERSQANGFFLAPGIAQDKSHELVYGGGVCQAATIIFNAAIMSGCQILDKDSHSWPLYTALDDFGSDARDAMVNWGTSDLVFKNITEHPIYFDTYMYWKYPDNATHAYCNVYTTILPDGQSMEYEPRLLETREAPEPTYIALGDDPEPEGASWKWDAELELLVYKHIPSKPYKFYDVYQIIKDADGNIISELLWYKSEYGEIKGEYYTKPDPSKEPADDGVG